MGADCTIVPEDVKSDAGVAGIGVLLSFIATAAIALTISATLIIQEMRSSSSSSLSFKPSVLRRKLLNAYSDQQILTGIGIQSVGLAKTSTMAPYHFFIIWMLSLLSMAVHNATLLALVHDFRRDWVLRWLRQLLMFGNLALSCVYGVFVLRGVQTGLSDATLPVACVWSPDVPAGARGPAAGNVAVSYAGTIAVVAGNVAVFALGTWYLHSRTQRFYRAIQLIGLLLMTASAVGATARVVVMAQAFAEPPVQMSDEGERVWSFGSLLSIGMLLLPLVSAIEILRGEIKCAPPVVDDGMDDKSALLGGVNELEDRTGRSRSSFQPNPFWGSQTNLFKK